MSSGLNYRERNMVWKLLPLDDVSEFTWFRFDVWTNLSEGTVVDQHLMNTIMTNIQLLPNECLMVTVGL